MQGRIKRIASPGHFCAVADIAFIFGLSFACRVAFFPALNFFLKFASFVRSEVLSRCATPLEFFSKWKSYIFLICRENCISWSPKLAEYVRDYSYYNECSFICFDWKIYSLVLKKKKKRTTNTVEIKIEQKETESKEDETVSVTNEKIVLKGISKSL